MREETRKFLDEVKPSFKNLSEYGFTKLMDEYFDEREKFIEKYSDIKNREHILPICTFLNITIVEEMIECLNFKYNNFLFKSGHYLMITAHSEYVTDKRPFGGRYTDHIVRNEVLGMFNSNEDIKEAKMNALYRFFARKDKGAQITFYCAEVTVNRTDKVLLKCDTTLSYN